MALDLFDGIRVSDCDAANGWYERSNGVSTSLYREADGNEIGSGGAPA